MQFVRVLVHNRRWQPRWRLLTAALVLVVAWFALMPAADVPEVAGDKVNHVLAFIALATSASLAGLRPRMTAALLIGYGGFIEVAQSFLPTRHGDLADLLADAVGIALGLLLFAGLRRLAAAEPTSIR